MVRAMDGDALVHASRDDISLKMAFVAWPNNVIVQAVSTKLNATAIFDASIGDTHRTAEHLCGDNSLAATNRHRGILPVHRRACDNDAAAEVDNLRVRWHATASHPRASVQMLQRAVKLHLATLSVAQSCQALDRRLTHLEVVMRISGCQRHAVIARVDELAVLGCTPSGRAHGDAVADSPPAALGDGQRVARVAVIHEKRPRCLGNAEYVESAVA